MTLSIQLIQIPETETVPKREFYLDGPKVEIGRDYASDICLPDMSEKISRRHVVLNRLTAGGYTATDVSTNGVELNNSTMPRNEARPLRDGDILSFLGYKLLLSIVENARAEDTPGNDLLAHDPFETESDFSTTGPLLTDVEVEDVETEPDRGFSGTVRDLDDDLMFDPFADGPGMREAEEPKHHFNHKSSAEPKPVEQMELVNLPQPMHTGTDVDLALRGYTYQQTALEAVERTLERFFDEVDPNVLEEDYKMFIPRLMWGKKRFWAIHRRQFAKKKANGEFRRSFLALFAEEMRKQ